MSQTDVTRAESIDEQEARREADSDKKPKNRRPASENTFNISLCGFCLFKMHMLTVG